MSQFRNFMLILSSYVCDKRCPYCTAKTTKWQEGPDNLEVLSARLDALAASGVSFDTFVLSGNGEPGLYPVRNLELVAGAYQRYAEIFSGRRVQTSGRFFLRPDIWGLYQDWDFRITRCSPNDDEDCKWLGYKHKYTQSSLFKRSRVSINHVLLNETRDRLQQDLDDYIDRFSNITSISLTVLNVNTLNNDYSNAYSQWILKHAVLKAEAHAVFDQLCNAIDFVAPYDEHEERYSFSYRGVPVYFLARKSKYGRDDIVYYRGNLVDYNLVPIKGFLTSDIMRSSLKL